MMLEDGAYFGDGLVCVGDFHLPPAGAVRAATHNGALLFLLSRPG